MFVKTNELFVPCAKFNANKMKKNNMLQNEADNAQQHLIVGKRGEWWTWYFLLLDGLRGASTKPPNTAPLQSPTTWNKIADTENQSMNEESKN